MYEYDWPHIDAPDLAGQVWKHLTESGVKAKPVERGVDHGVWVPFKLMFPHEKPLDLLVIQVSTYHGYDLESQICLGQIFESLRYVIELWYRAFEYGSLIGLLDTRVTLSWDLGWQCTHSHLLEGYMTQKQIRGGRR